MPWKKTDHMNERIRFIARYLEGVDPFSHLCGDFNISRKTGYKWVERYELFGSEYLSDQSRRPIRHAHAVPRDIIDRILEARRKHPRWGPKKLLVIIQRQYPRLKLPVASTVGEILKRHGMIKSRKRRRYSSSYGEKLGGYDYANAIWCADFKGHFPVGGK